MAFQIYRCLRENFELCSCWMTMQQTDGRIAEIFTKISHHKNLSVLYLTQNLFYKNAQSRTISLNSHFLVIFKNTRDITQIAVLARQMYAGKFRFMLEAFNDATSAHRTAAYSSIWDLRSMRRCGLELIYFPEKRVTCTWENRAGLY